MVAKVPPAIPHEPAYATVAAATALTPGTQAIAKHPTPAVNISAPLIIEPKLMLPFITHSYLITYLPI